MEGEKRPESPASSGPRRGNTSQTSSFSKWHLIGLLAKGARDDLKGGAGLGGDFGGNLDDQVYRGYARGMITGLIALLLAPILIGLWLVAVMVCLAIGGWPLALAALGLSVLTAAQARG